MTTLLPLFPFSALFLALSTVPHHWQMRPGSFATLSMVAWLASQSFVQGVNAAMWAQNDVPLGGAWDVWCDIATKITIGGKVAVTGSSISLVKQLHRIISGQELEDHGKFAWTLDILLCWAIPVLVMALHIIVQSHRFDIIQPFGCLPTVYFSWPSLLIINLPVYIYGVLAPVYAARILYALYRRHRALRMQIQSWVTRSEVQRNGHRTIQHRAMSFVTFIRLLLATLLSGTVTTGIIAYGIISAFVSGPALLPWSSWTDVHKGISTIYSYKLSEFRGSALADLWIEWCAAPTVGIMVSLLFSFGKDVRMEWQERWQSLRVREWLAGRKTKSLCSSIGRPPSRSNRDSTALDVEQGDIIIIGPEE
uniref:STE3-domain-containing protein n=1 Tax=Mycena chlorophos TaxID=658473 RepID=A0ABQ0L015_MYCCL|nr:STE3-domain-containing protein [Mycena chlorophos]